MTRPWFPAELLIATPNVLFLFTKVNRRTVSD
jgi:hypothetical protein